MKTYKILFADGNTIETGFNGTLKDVADYYLFKYFQFGDTDECPRDKMVMAIDVSEVA